MLRYSRWAGLRLLRQRLRQLMMLMVFSPLRGLMKNFGRTDGVDSLVLVSSARLDSSVSSKLVSMAFSTMMSSAGRAAFLLVGRS